MKRLLTLTIAFLFVLSSLSFAGGINPKKGLEEVTVKGKLICIGCKLMMMSGAKPQCKLYAHHAIGFRTEDGVIWNILENEKGHDIIRAHKLVHKGVKATITGWLYPIAHIIEIDSIEVEGISMAKIQKAAWKEDQIIAKKLMSRKVGEPPMLGAAH